MKQACLRLLGGGARARELEKPPCARSIGCRKEGWIRYAAFATKLRKLGLHGKPWVYVGLGFIEVCCPNHDANVFDAGRKFRIKDVDVLLSYDAELRMGLGAKR